MISSQVKPRASNSKVSKQHQNLKNDFNPFTAIGTAYAVPVIFGVLPYGRL
jgi:hypothetical protein